MTVLNLVNARLVDPDGETVSIGGLLSSSRTLGSCAEARSSLVVMSSSGCDWMGGGSPKSCPETRARTALPSIAI